MMTVAFAVTLMLLVAASGFGIWAYLGMEDYKTNADQKIAEAVKVAEERKSAEKDAQFLEQEKLPFKLYQGPAAYGSLAIQYPKTWSAFVSEKDSGSTPIEGYFHPNYVPGIHRDNSYALRVEVSNTSYADELKRFDSAVKQGKATVQAYVSQSSPSTVGARIDGEIASKKQGAMVMLPLRDKTLKMWTESEQFKGDFDGIILKNFGFTP